ncbi:hypothetical protein Goari_015930 [Gossypium aridum]|uniref:Uncharacterized protein n=1 Tax=Gossypium aridum TaxID=34290 RepID=A0A7J8WH02_GOSAI|nr:hypothetical protein [Gossypium aridum]
MHNMSDQELLLRASSRVPRLQESRGHPKIAFMFLTEVHFPWLHCRKIFSRDTKAFIQSMFTHILITTK